VCVCAELHAIVCAYVGYVHMGLSGAPPMCWLRTESLNVCWLRPESLPGMYVG
jgi:hypothetical protein